MAAIGTLGPASSGVEALSETFKNADGKDRDADSTTQATPTLVEGVKVSLSGASIERSAGSGGDNRDIEESGLPENIQQLLKMIRKLQKQIAEKKALIEKIMADKRLSNEEKIIKVGALRGAIAALNTGLITANLALSKVVGQSGLTSDQNLKVGSLLMKN
ncbi:MULTISPECIES: hypothetical protein [Pseudomonas]|uniref:hypothetical protein n=1 Tax=Pseudomonas TaxID=286 RepID=UPI0012426A18|nr:MULTISPECIES: hypothetical protein [Pseudomonas]MBP5944442.1 hypothetical protein [Pseudomonas sp. P9(2020)]MBP5958362.1 hypothetical protein [Pseudomonas anatoliensis]MBZ9560940.1 hypothetical protein [Pseudomonas sp. P116]VVO89169.1 hypothetical protein PS898_02228 [Pseudomonas fluorescens]